MVTGLCVTARSAGPASAVPQVDMRASTKSQTTSRRCAAQFSVSCQPHSAIDRLIDLWGTDGRQLGGEGKCMFAPKATTKLSLSSSPLHKIKDVLVSWKRSRDASPESAGSETAAHCWRAVSGQPQSPSTRTTRLPFIKTRLPICTSPLRDSEDKF